ncbi:hypothetical protein F511_33137 [Dorcoceras hygrometricum]|uniref:Uncharacterized protein n=1 Tax=Dorcoceras hygrometricum TaxID=472368 RepID=A0A2Z7CIB6_9LAMI|nr:hypothetical protein F511_33137 [Dorcoceras hygrometricum]
MKKAVSKKRPAAAVVEPTVKRKRTLVGKADDVAKDTALVTVAQEAVPLQIVAPIFDVTPAPKRKAPKRKLRLEPGSDDETETVEKESTVEEPVLDTSAETAKLLELEITGVDEIEKIVEQQDNELTADDVDTIIEKILADTTHMEVDAGETDVGDQTIQRSDEKESRIGGSAEDFTTLDFHEEERLIETGSDTEEELETDKVTDPEPLTSEKNQEAEAEMVTTADESLSIEEHLAQIPDNLFLPSVLAADITQIRYGQGIEIREVDIYKASLPQIADTDKGKKPLVEYSVQGLFSLICADLDFLVQLREQVIKDVAKFFSSFSLKRLAVLGSTEDIAAKEENVLSWAETDSVQIALQRRGLIITKYRELLLRKFLEVRRNKFVSGTPTTAIDLKVLDLLTAAHHFALKVLLTQMREQKLVWTRPSSSNVFEEATIARGFHITRNHLSTFSTCWIRAKIMVDGSWLILEGVYYWRPISKPVDSYRWETVPQQPYFDDLAPLGALIEALQDIDSRDLVGPFVYIEEVPQGFQRVSQSGIDSDSFVGYFTAFTDSYVQPVFQCLPDVDLVSSDGSTVYRSPSPQSDSSHSLQDTDSTKPSVQIDTDIVLQDTVIQPDTDQLTISAFADPSVQLELTQHPDSPTPTDDSSMRFNADDTHLKDDTPVDQISLPVATDVSASFAELRCSSRSSQADITSIELKAVRAQNVVLMTDLADTRKEVQELKAAFSNDILDFRAQAQENYNKLTTQLSELVDYINRVGNDKKGESSSRGPQPPPDDKDRGSGASRVLVDIKCWVSGSAPRHGSGRTIELKPGDDQYEKFKTNYDIHRMFKRLPCWHLCLAPTGITRTRLFSVDCGSFRQSGPRPDPRLLRQTALEALTRSARTDSPCRVGRK